MRKLSKHQRPLCAREESLKWISKDEKMRQWDQRHSLSTLSIVHAFNTYRRLTGEPVVLLESETSNMMISHWVQHTRGCISIFV